MRTLTMSRGWVLKPNQRSVFIDPQLVNLALTVSLANPDVL